MYAYLFSSFICAFYSQNCVSLLCSQNSEILFLQIWSNIQRSATLNTTRQQLVQSMMSNNRDVPMETLIHCTRRLQATGKSTTTRTYMKRYLIIHGNYFRSCWKHFGYVCVVLCWLRHLTFRNLRIMECSWWGILNHLFMYFTSL